jgi:hypothetical protein
LNDASLKQTIVDTGGYFIQFSLGIPVSGMHIEDPGTEYADCMQIFMNENKYLIGIMQLGESNKHSANHKAIIWYI